MWFENLDRLDDLQKAIDYGTRALELTPDNGPDFPKRLQHLETCFNTRFERLSEPRDLEKAIEYESRALESTPSAHPFLAGRLANLAVSLDNRL
ncbi:hypothetical protein OPQ81_011914 [Rhizoctonia solani]|nr:hypothetical protein OPQ81_011914 [Rhizoctonia solani]